MGTVVDLCETCHVRLLAGQPGVPLDTAARQRTPIYALGREWSWTPDAARCVFAPTHTGGLRTLLAPQAPGGE